MADRTPETIIADLAPAYQQWKSGEKDKNKFKDEFFEAITAFLTDKGDQAEDLIFVTAKSPEEAQELAQKRHPGWIIEDWRDHPIEAGAYEIIIKEDPAFQAFYIEYDDKVWGRQVSSGATYVDDDRLEEQDPDLWIEVTALPYEDLLRDIAYEAGKEPDEVEQYVMEVAERHGVHRALKPLSELEPEVLARLQPYVFEGKPTVKLPAPKKAES